MPHTVAYIRVSKDAQDRRSQVKAIEQWLANTHRKVSEWIEDAGGRDIAYKRAGFQRMIERVQTGDIKTIVVAERDRFGVADAEEWGYYVTILRRNGCHLWVASEDKDLAAREDRTESFMAAINSERSRNEQEARAQREHRSKLALVERAEWPGGKPAYGFDLVCRQGGKELWRLIYEAGVYRRKQVFPSGQVRRFDGKDNTPARSKGETLHLAINEEQAKWVRKIFDWFIAGESYRGIANKLQSLKVPPIHREIWHHATIAFIVAKNPTYLTGVPTWNKFAHGRFIERIGGKWVAVERIGGRTKNARRRDKSDYVQANPIPGVTGIVSQQVWNAAQARLRRIAANPRAERKPKSPALYFSGLIRCGNCGRAMIADTQAMIYRCASNMLDKSVCWCNRVRHDRLEEVVEQWLIDTQQTLSVMEPEWCVRLMELEEEATPMIKQYTQRITEMWREARALDPKELHWTYKKLRAALGRDSVNLIAAEITEKESEIARLTERLGKVRSEAASDAVLKRIDALGESVRALRARQEVDQLDALRSRLWDLQRRTKEAREESPLRRTQAIRRVIGGIVAKHEHFMRGKLRSSRLVGVEIRTRVGETVLGDDMSRGDQPRRIAGTHVTDEFLARLLVRPYSLSC